MADEEDIAALVIDNGSGMCKGKFKQCGVLSRIRWRRRKEVKVVRGHWFLSGRHIVGGIAAIMARFGLRGSMRVRGIAPTAGGTLYMHCAAMVGVLWRAPHRESERNHSAPPRLSSRCVAVYRSKIGTKTNIQKYSDP